jgi:c-di-GMP-binding flagellar brake protein YcgR
MRSSTNGAKAVSERRKWMRLPLAIPVFVRSRDHNSNETLEFATILNVSAGGMLVAVRKVPLLNSEIHLEIPSVTVSAPNTISKVSRGLRARVLRSTPVEGYTLLGLKFSHPLLTSPDRRKSRKGKVVSVA